MGREGREVPELGTPCGNLYRQWEDRKREGGPRRGGHSPLVLKHLYHRPLAAHPLVSAGLQARSSILTRAQHGRPLL